ncbi:GDP-mannose transporter into the lumen of the Golgi [Malassezia psittaci]|uniref:GDP-mannose transporter n=1 Tax=Malassezia psittaci TaxID=1821823 RepID=A0AAF0JFH2_9BASI|nr:GDP-mannose transporter into the lumen of the Golgi [Malassezia psittaci]
MAGSASRDRSHEEALELGTFRGDSEPGTESDSAKAQLLSHERSSGDTAARSSEPSGYAHAAAPVLSYCVASISMTVINKFTVSGAGFTMNLLVLLCQCTVGVIMVYGAKLLGWIELRALNKRDIKTWSPISTMLVFVIWTGSKALQYMDIPIYTIFKNLTIILIAYGEMIWFGGRITRMIFTSFVLMVLSSVVAAWPDISGSFSSSSTQLHSRAQPSNALGLYSALPTMPTSNASAAQSSNWSNLGQNGYLWMLTNCMVSAAYVLVMRKRIKLTGFKDWDTMFYNNLLSIPVLIIMSFAVENWSTETLQRNFPEGRRYGLMMAIFLSGTGGVFISYTTAWCIRTTSSTTYSMVGALNKLPLALSGMVFFGNQVTFYNSTGIALGFLAGIVYAVGKNKQAEQSRLANSAATGVESSRNTAGGGHVSDPKGVIPTHTRQHDRQE